MFVSAFGVPTWSQARKENRERQDKSKNARTQIYREVVLPDRQLCTVLITLNHNNKITIMWPCARNKRTANAAWSPHPPKNKSFTDARSDDAGTWRSHEGVPYWMDQAKNSVIALSMCKKQPRVTATSLGAVTKYSSPEQQPQHHNNTTYNTNNNNIHNNNSNSNNSNSNNKKLLHTQQHRCRSLPWLKSVTKNCGHCRTQS